jgi:hypothetical protein
MNREQVISFVDSLSKGLHPVTGAPVPEDLSGAPEVTEALETAAALLRAAATRPAAAGARWTDDEDARLCREFDNGGQIRELAREHGRTVGAITSRLVRLGRIDPDSVKTRERGAQLAS